MVGIKEGGGWNRETSQLHSVVVSFWSSRAATYDMSDGFGIDRGDALDECGAILRIEVETVLWP